MQPDTWGTVGELLGADTDVLERHAESLSLDARRAQDLHTLAQRAVTELQAGWNGSDLTALTRLWEQQGSPLLAGVSASLDACATTLRAQSAAQRAASGKNSGDDNVSEGPARANGMTSTASMTPAPSPPVQGSPADNAIWWRSLSLLQQQQVIGTHPDWVGGRDGVPFSARDLANRALLRVEHARLTAERERLQADLARSWAGGWAGGSAAGWAGGWAGDLPTRELAALNLVAARDLVAALDRAAALDRVRDELAALGSVTAVLAGPGERQLLLLDLAGQRAEAAIANGNVETADNVAVFVPGMSATVAGSLQVFDKEMGQLQKRAELESKKAQAGLSTATVTWIGYQAPQKGLDLVGASSVLGIRAAESGAAKLVPFLQGIGTSRDSDAHLTLLGHSYGSTTAGLALRQVTGADDAVFFGSPGLGTSDVGDLRLEPGRAHYIEAQRDLVGDVGRFGGDPSHLTGVDHPSALESTVTDPLTGEVRRFTGVSGHSSYLADDSTSQYNLSVIVAGVPERAVLSDGQDLGDVPSWALGRARQLSGP